MGTKDFPPNGRCPCGSRLRSEDCHRLGPDEEAALEASTVDAMRTSGVDPAVVYAYERTHLIITSDFRAKNLLDAAADLDEWDDAIMEYRQLHQDGPTHWVDALRFGTLVARLREIDAKLAALATEISESVDPDGEGLFEECEDLAGDGFLACQIFQIERMGPKMKHRSNPLFCGPMRNSRYVAEMIHVAGNYHKHVGEWPRDEAKYDDNQLNAIAAFSGIGVTSPDYRLFNTLGELTEPSPARFSALVPKIVEWREAVDQLTLAAQAKARVLGE